MRRVLVAFASVLVLSIGMATVSVGIGDTEVNLTCDDGTSLDVVVDTGTLLGLTEVVQAMLDYPAGMTCGLAQAPLTTRLLPNSVAVAADKKDFAVGAVGVAVPVCGIGSFTGNISFEADSDATNTALSTKGMIHEQVQPTGDCPVNGTFKAEVHCLTVLPGTSLGGSGSDSGRIAIMSGPIVQTTGDFFPTFQRAILFVQDNGSPGSLDRFDINVDTVNPNADMPTNFCHNYLGPNRTPTHGNAVVHDEVP